MGENDAPKRENKIDQRVGNKEDGGKDNRKKNRGRIEVPEKAWISVQNKFDALEKADDNEEGNGDAGKETVNEDMVSTPKVQ